MIMLAKNIITHVTRREAEAYPFSGGNRRAAGAYKAKSK